MRVTELKLRYEPGPATGADPTLPRIVSPKEAAAVLAPFCEYEAVETFGVLCLSVRGDVLGYHHVSRGDLSQAIVHPSEVFKAAILANAATIVLAHNHPSGDPQPSHDDMALTRRLESAGDLLGVQVQDHLIIGHHGRYYSFSHAGLLPSRSRP